MDALLFGYGSLISPVSLVSKIRDPDTLSEVYETDGEPYVMDEELEAWREFQGEVERTPAKLYGFRRYYSKESIRGGAVLQGVRTADPADWINGILIHNLTEDQYENIVSTEPGYSRYELADPDIEFYDSGDAAEYSDDPVEVFVLDADPSDLSIAVRRNRVYHGRITAGIRLLEEEYDESVAERFLEDFRESTFELARDASGPDDFVTVAENDRKRRQAPDGSR